MTVRQPKLKAEIEVIWAKRHKVLPRIIAKLANVSAEHGISVEILAGISLIEGSKRPRLWQCFEYALFRLNQALTSLFGVPLRDMTIGPMQLRASLIMHQYGRYAATPDEHFWLAAKYISYLQQQTAEGQSDIGLAYNGSQVYATVLRSLVDRLKGTRDFL